MRLYNGCQLWQKLLKMNFIFFLIAVVGLLNADKNSHYDVYHKKQREVRLSEMQAFILANRIAYEDCLTKLSELICLRFLFNSDFFWSK